MSGFGGLCAMQDIMRMKKLTKEEINQSPNLNLVYSELSRFTDVTKVNIREDKMCDNTYSVVVDFSKGGITFIIGHIFCDGENHDFFEKYILEGIKKDIKNELRHIDDMLNECGGDGEKVISKYYTKIKI